MGSLTSACWKRTTSLRSFPSRVSTPCYDPYSTHYAGTAFCFRALAENTPTGLDWGDSQTDLAHLGGVAPGAAKSEGDKLWEDNWDDDDIEEEFSVQLR